MSLLPVKHILTNCKKFNNIRKEMDVSHQLNTGRETGPRQQHENNKVFEEHENI